MKLAGREASRSVLLYSHYLFVLGTVLLVMPNVLLSMISVPQTREVWIRILGWLVVVLGSWYRLASRYGDQRLIQWTVTGRLATLTVLSVLVLSRLAPPALLLFGLLDGAGAWWTFGCLRAHRRID